MVSNVEFRHQLKKIRSYHGGTNHGGNNSHGIPTDDMPNANERTPLVSSQQNGSSNHRDSDNRPMWRKVLLDTKHTPGDDSSNPFVKWPLHAFNIFKAVLFSNYVNVLLVFVPLGLIAGVGKWGATIVFTLNFFAIIPLAAILSFATEEISVKLGETLGGLLNATFGNAVELIVSIIALRDNQIEVVQSSMLGSILSNLLLVMGMCFFLGGITNMRDGQGNGSEQSFASGTAQTTCSLMALSAASMIIPATLATVLSQAHEKDPQANILLLSRATAIILLLLYGAYLYFQLRTHKNLFNPDGEAKNNKNQNGDAENGEDGDNNNNTTHDDSNKDDDDESDEEPAMGAWSAAAVLVAVTLVISFCADYLVDSIDEIVATGHISKNFIGLILIPIVGNAAEHVTACVVAVRGKMDLAMGVAVGSSVQIALLVTPFLVILGWIMDVPMSLQFEKFETVVFFISVLCVTYTVQDGKSNYLEGAMLMGLYCIIAVAFYVTPNDALEKVFALVGR